jgi:hypothetical protein
MRQIFVAISLLIALFVIEPTISADAGNSMQKMSYGSQVRSISALETANVPQDYDENSDLIKRILRTSDSPSGRIQDVSLLVGEIPENISPEIPFPEGSKIIGSMVRNHSIEIVMNSNLTQDQIFKFYQDRMEELNWSEIGEDDFGPTRGFLPDMSCRTFCQGEASPSVTVCAYPGNVTDLRIILDSDTPNACSQYPDIDWPKPLPRLIAPTGSNMHPADYSSGDESVFSSGILETDLNTISLMDHYSSQIRKGGWNIEENGSYGLSSWSTWNFTDEEGQNWIGSFLILDSSHDTKKHFLLFRAEITQEEIEAAPAIISIPNILINPLRAGDENTNATLFGAIRTPLRGDRTNFEEILKVAIGLNGTENATYSLLDGNDSIYRPYKYMPIKSGKQLVYFLIPQDDLFKLIGVTPTQGSPFDIKWWKTPKWTNGNAVIRYYGIVDWLPNADHQDLAIQLRITNNNSSNLMMSYENFTLLDQSRIVHYPSSGFDPVVIGPLNSSPARGKVRFTNISLMDRIIAIAFDYGKPSQIVMDLEDQLQLSDETVYGTQLKIPSNGVNGSRVDGSDEPLNEISSVEVLINIGKGLPIEYDNVLIKGDLNLSRLNLPIISIKREESQALNCSGSKNLTLVNSTLNRLFAVPCC